MPYLNFFFLRVADLNLLILDSNEELKRRREKLFSWNQNMKAEEAHVSNSNPRLDEVDSLDVFMSGIENKVRQLCSESLIKIDAETRVVC